MCSTDIQTREGEVSHGTVATVETTEIHHLGVHFCNIALRFTFCKLPTEVCAVDVYDVVHRIRFVVVHFVRRTTAKHMQSRSWAVIQLACNAI